jgi:hypothetical protein
LRINGGEREGRCAVCMSGVWLTDKEVEGRGDGQMEERKGEGGEGGGPGGGGGRDGGSLGGQLPARHACDARTRRLKTQRRAHSDARSEPRAAHRFGQLTGRFRPTP